LYLGDRTLTTTPSRATGTDTAPLLSLGPDGELPHHTRSRLPGCRPRNAI